MKKPTRGTGKNPLLQTLIAMTGQDNTITVHRPFVEFTGTLEAAMMLSQLLYWTPRATIPGGWVAKSDKDWEKELCLSRYSNRGAAKVLKSMGVIETKLKKFNNAPTTHYRIIWKSLEKKWVEWIKVGLSEIEQTDCLKSNKRIVRNRTIHCLKSNNPLSENGQSLTETTPETTAEITTKTTPTSRAGKATRTSKEKAEAGVAGAAGRKTTPYAELKAGESMILPQTVSITVNGEPLYTMVTLQGTINVRQILAATELIEDFGDIATGLPVDALKPDIVLGWIAKSYDTRHHLKNPPAGMLYNQLRNADAVKRPPQRYMNDPAQFLPDEFCAALRLQKYDCKSCVDQKFSTLAEYEAHLDAEHTQPIEEREYPEPVVVPDYMGEPFMEGLSPTGVWQSVLAQLQMDMPRAAYDTWVRHSQAIAFDGYQLTVCVRNLYAKDWLEDRLTTTVNRLVGGIFGLPTPPEVRFVVAQVGIEMEVDA
jgi:hypothetical protein